MFQTVMLIAEPGKVNHILAELADSEARVVSLTPIWHSGGSAQDVMITYQVEHESEDAQFAHLAWVEMDLAQFCKVY